MLQISSILTSSLTDLRVEDSGVHSFWPSDDLASGEQALGG